MLQHILHLLQKYKKTLRDAMFFILSATYLAVLTYFVFFVVFVFFVFFVIYANNVNYDSRRGRLRTQTT